jgi:hypothetical protein
MFAYCENNPVVFCDASGFGRSHYTEVLDQNFMDEYERVLSMFGLEDDVDFFVDDLIKEPYTFRYASYSFNDKKIGSFQAFFLRALGSIFDKLTEIFIMLSPLTGNGAIGAAVIVETTLGYFTSKYENILPGLYEEFNLVVTYRGNSGQFYSFNIDGVYYQRVWVGTEFQTGDSSYQFIKINMTKWI